jgi:uncharacterized protein (DUF1501 family)
MVFDLLLQRRCAVLTLPLGRATRYCDGISRRSFLQLGSLGLGGLTLADLLCSRAQAGEAAKSSSGDNAVILIWLEGGPSHMDTYDLKPLSPAEYRGMFTPIATNLPGVQVTELFPEQSKVMDKLTIIRSICHRSGDHISGPHHMLTGYHGSSVRQPAPMYPSVGSITAKLRGANKPNIPAYVAIPQAVSYAGIKPGYHGAAYLGLAYNPFDAGGDPSRRNFKVPNLQVAGGLTTEMLEDRRRISEFLSNTRRKIDSSGLLNGLDRFNAQAFEMTTGEAARSAFDLSREDDALRDRYGRDLLGQGALLARRLVEAGVTFVTLISNGWDHHGGIERGLKRKLPPLDKAVAALVDDLHQRGLYERTIVIVMGEFGRTPRVNAGAGRDHWPDAMAVLVGGGGLRVGQVIGATDAKGQRPSQRPLSPKDFWATIYRKLGIDTHIAFRNPTGRPVPVLDVGAPIEELIA